jgi:hypothetical protein
MLILLGSIAAVRRLRITKWAVQVVVELVIAGTTREAA